MKMRWLPKVSILFELYAIFALFIALFGFERRRDVTRDFSRRDQNRVEANVAVDIVRIEREPRRGRRGDPALLTGLQ
jgi:hypothetical protein